MLLILIIVFIIPMACKVIPTLSRTYLMDDIRSKTFSIAAGTEIPIGEGGAILPDPIYEYISYAPNDWLEIGAAGHWGIGLFGVEAKVDVIDIFTDGLRVSAIIGGGISVASGSEDTGVALNASLCANMRMTESIELYAGIGGSSISQVPSVHAGVNIDLFRWLSISANAKLVINTQEKDPDPPAALMLSICPSLNFQTGDKSE